MVTFDDLGLPCKRSWTFNEPPSAKCHVAIRLSQSCRLQR